MRGLLVTVMKTKIEDLIGMWHTKLGFFKEVQVKIGELQKSNLKLERKRRQVQAILDGIADIVAVVTPQYRIRTINNSFYTENSLWMFKGLCCAF